MALPESVRKLLQQQQAGYYETPQQRSSAGDVMSMLQQAASRRFGQSGQADPEYDEEIRGLMSQIPDLEAGYQNAQQRVDEDFTLGAEELDREKTLADGRHVNTMANNGIGYSGANLIGQGRIAEGFQRGVQGLATNRSRTLSDLSGAQNAAYRQLTSRAGSAQGQAANRATEQDERRAWEMEQVRMEQESAKAQQEYAERGLAMQQQIMEQNEAARRRMEQQLTAMSQPQPTATGAYRMPTPAAPAPQPAQPRPTPYSIVHTPDLMGSLKKPKRKRFGLGDILKPFTNPFSGGVPR